MLYHGIIREQLGVIICFDVDYNNECSAAMGILIMKFIAFALIFIGIVVVYLFKKSERQRGKHAFEYATSIEKSGQDEDACFHPYTHALILAGIIKEGKTLRTNKYIYRCNC